MSSKQENVVELTALRKVFRDFWNRARVAAVDDLDLQIRDGEIFGLLGPNGSGKSTTIKMILGLLKPTSGIISVFGMPPSDVRTKQRIGFLPEESYLYPFLSAWETLDYYGRLFRQPRDVRRQRIEMLLDMVGLSAVAYRRVGEYSKGMQRRIGLAQALINDPDLLILDEPTSGLDPIGARQFKDLIITLGKRGKTVILSSHLLDDVEDVCDRVAILYGGRKRAQGDISELLSQSDQTQIIAESLSEKSLNEIRQLVKKNDGRELLEVSSPRDKLENLFLRIVEKAQNEKVATGGALGTGTVAKFLSGDDDDSATGRQLLDKLVQTDEPAATQAETTTAAEKSASEDKPKVDAGVLSDLTSEAAPAAEAEESTPKQRPDEKPAPRVDRSVLDSLVDESDGDRSNE